MSEDKLFGIQKRQWENAGKHQPFFSVMIDDKYRSDVLEDREKRNEFYQVGGDVSNIEICCVQAGIEFPSGVCMDYGCGVGRSSHALAKVFDKVYGIDISSEHTAKAKAFCQENGIVNAEFHAIADVDDLKKMGVRFDFIYSIVVLQHNRPELIKRILDTWCDVLAPNGIIFFQLPTFHPAYDWNHQTFAELDFRDILLWSEMHCLRQSDVFQFFHDRSFVPLGCWHAEVDPDPHYANRWFMFRAKGPRGTISAAPNPCRPAGADFGKTTLRWEVEKGRTVEVRLDTPDGPLIARADSPGGMEVESRDGSAFLLQDTTDGLPLSQNHTLDAVKVEIMRREGGTAEGISMYSKAGSEYDTAPADNIERSYIIACLPGAGAATLCDSLEKSAVAGLPMEYFHRSFVKSFVTRMHFTNELPLHYALQKDTMGTYARKLQAVRSSHGVFGMAIYWEQLEWFFLKSEISLDSVFAKHRCIYLTREDQVAQAISWAVAQQTETDGSGSAPPPAYSERQIGSLLDDIKRQEQMWENYFKRENIQPLRITYEQLVRDHEPTVEKVLHILGVSGHARIVSQGACETGSEFMDDWKRRFGA